MFLKVRKWIFFCATITYNYSKTVYERVKYVYMNQLCYGEDLIMKVLFWK